MTPRARSGNVRAKVPRGTWLGSRWRDEIRPVTLVSNVTAGLTVGLLTVIMSVSLATLLFGGPLSAFRANGIGIALISSALIGLTVALLGSLPGAVAQIQSAPIAILTGAAFAIVASIPAPAPPTAGFMTVVAVVALSTLTTGAIFLGVSLLGIGRMVRYVPFPVVSGFIAGTGWLLFIGGIGVMAGVQPSMAHLRELAAPHVWLHWLPAIVFASVAVLVTRTHKHFLVLPLIIVGAVALFYLTVALSGHSLADWRSAGLLLGPFPDANLLRPFNPADLRYVHWPSVAHSVPTIASVVFFSMMELLFNATGMELGTGRKVDLNREIRVAGLGNLVAGSVGGMSGYHGLSFTLLSLRTGTGSRIASLTSVCVVLMTLAAGVSLLAYMPTVVVGGLLSYLGLTLMVEPLFEGRSKLSPLEYAIVWAILVAIATAGFLPGIGLGLVLTVVLFIFTYSRVAAVRHALSGRNQRSRVRRDAEDRDFLCARGDAVLVLQLQGFLFFGTANGIVSRVERRLEASPPLECLILDLHRVTGFDATAVASFARLIRMAEGERFAIGSTGLPPWIIKQLHPSAADDGQLPPVATFPDLDAALEWNEERFLKQRGVAPEAGSPAEQATTNSADVGAEPNANALPGVSAPSEAGLRGFARGGFEPARLAPYLERIDLPAGRSVIRQGDTSDALYFVASGQFTARLEQDGVPTSRLETMRAGSLLGELGFYGGTARTASVVADEPSTAYCLTHASIKRLTTADPALAADLHELVVRLLAERVVHLMSVVEELEL